MRIVFISNNYTPYSGGIVSSINTTIEALQKKGYEVTLITLDFLGKKHTDPEWVKRIPSFIRFRYKHNYLAIPWRPIYYLTKWIKEFEPDIIHLHHPFLLGPIAMRIAKKRGIKTVFTYHTQYDAYIHYVPLPQLFVKSIIKRMVQNFCNKVNYIIAPSQSIKEYIGKNISTPIAVIPTGLPNLFLQQPFIQKDLKSPIKLLYVGRFAKEKNIPFLLDVVAQLPDNYFFTLVGFGVETDYLRQYAYKICGLSPKQVQFIIKPERKKLIALYRAAHLFLFASQTETQGIVIAESMSCSTPVIALDGMGQKDSIDNDNNGFIVSTKKEMQQIIQTICCNQMFYNQLQRNAYKTAQQYDSAQLIDRLVQFYNAIEKNAYLV